MESVPKNSSEDFNFEEELDRFSDDLLEVEEVSKILLFIFFYFTKKLLDIE